MSHTCPGVADYCLLAAGWLIAAPRASLSAQSSLFAAFPTLPAGHHAVLDTLMNPNIEIKSTFYKNIRFTKCQAANGYKAKVHSAMRCFRSYW